MIAVLVLLVATPFGQAPDAGAHVAIQEPNQGRVKADYGWTGLTIQFNKWETRQIANYPFAFNYLGLAGVPGAVTVLIANQMSQTAQAAVRNGRCLQYKKYYIGPLLRTSQYSGGYCR